MALKSEMHQGTFGGELWQARCLEGENTSEADGGSSSEPQTETLLNLVLAERVEPTKIEFDQKPVGEQEKHTKAS